MRAGKLDREIEIRTVIENTVKDDGTPVPGTILSVPARAQLVQATTDEYIAARGAVDRAVVIFRIRWRDDITNAGSVVYQCKTYNVKEVKEIGRRKGLELRCEALS